MSDRQLNDQWFHHLRVDEQRLLSEGALWEWRAEFALASAGEEVVSMKTGGRPVLLLDALFTTDGTRGADLEFYAGGIVTNGTLIQGLPNNHSRPKPDPMAGVWQDSTVEQAGTLVGDRRLGEVLESGGPLPSLILADDFGYYVIVRNNHNQLANISLTMTIAGISDVPVGL